MERHKSQSQDGRKLPGAGLQARYAADLAALDAQKAAPRSPLIQAWGDFLRRILWTWFVTLTFRHAIHPEQAKKRVDRWIRALEKNPARNSQGSCRWALSWERQQRQVLHIHLLLADVGAIPIFLALALWRRIGNGSARIDRYDPQRGATYYLAKEGDIELSESSMVGLSASVADTRPALPQPKPVVPNRPDQNRSQPVFKETVVEEFTLGTVAGVEYRAKVAVRFQELCLDIRKFRNGYPMRQGIQLPVPIAEQLHAQLPTIDRAIKKHAKTRTSSGPQSPAKGGPEH